MSIFKRLVTVVKGHANDVGEAIADANALTELDQLLRECDESLEKAKASLTSMAAKRNLQDKKIADLQADIEKYTEGARKAKAAENMDLARQAVEKVIALQGDLKSAEDLRGQYAEAENNIRSNIKALQAKKERMRAEVDTVKATEQMQKSQEMLASSHANVNSSFSDASKSLERLKARQAEKAARLKAANELDDELTGTSLDKELDAIGGSSSAADDLLNSL
ncbi:MAG: PspA/IM30 family protein [Kordiimonas sp.]